MTHGLGLNKHNYYRFLRKVYGMGALEAWEYIKRVGPPPSVAAIQRAIKGERKYGQSNLSGSKEGHTHRLS